MPQEVSGICCEYFCDNEPCYGSLILYKSLYIFSIFEFITNCFILQDMACSSPLPITHKCAVNAVVAAYLNLMSQLTAIPALCQHIDTVSMAVFFVLIFNLS